MADLVFISFSLTSADSNHRSRRRTVVGRAAWLCPFFSLPIHSIPYESVLIAATCAWGQGALLGLLFCHDSSMSLLWLESILGYAVFRVSTEWVSILQQERVP